MLTTTITLLLLILGPVLAAFGVAGFFGNWSDQAPDHDSLCYLQVLAVSGRRMAYAGLALHLIHHGLPRGDTLLALLCVAALSLATYLTATTNTIIRAGATP